MIFVLYFVVGSHFGFHRLHFVVCLGALSWIDLYSVDPFSLQNHLEAPFTRNEQGDIEEVVGRSCFDQPTSMPSRKCLMASLPEKRW